MVPFIAHAPASRVGQPEDIGHVAVLLTTDEPRFMTGLSLLVDDGFTITGLR